jgi:hypothetical protein
MRSDSYKSIIETRANDFRNLLLNIVVQEELLNWVYFRTDLISNSCLIDYIQCIKQNKNKN